MMAQVLTSIPYYYVYLYEILRRVAKRHLWALLTTYCLKDNFILDSNVCPLEMKPLVNLIMQVLIKLHAHKLPNRNYLLKCVYL